MTDDAADLLPIDAVLAERLAAGDPLLAWRLGDNVATARAAVAQTLDLLAAVPRDPPFGAYLAAEAATGRIVGTCAFKTGPGAAGEVEIAYFTFPGHEGAGHATAMARALLALARDSGAVRRVVAHTLPEAGGSTRILEKLGFVHAGTVRDPEDGAVWRWVREVAAAS